MNREIKFRLWNTVRKDMQYDGGMGMVGNKLVQDEHNILMQFTGLKDNNLKDIYEGDIMYIAGVGNVEIIFSDGCFGYLFEGQFCSFYEDQEGDIENVIGNKFENPELLDAKGRKEE